jgi:CheY-like chemotaxis protein
VALTANAVSGVKEMFLESGLNDFISKPIDPTKLEGILVRWIPKEKHLKEYSSEEETKKPARSRRRAMRAPSRAAGDAPAAPAVPETVAKAAAEATARQEAAVAQAAELARTDAALTPELQGGELGYG